MDERCDKIVACLQDQSLREFSLFDKITSGDVERIAWTLKGNTWLVSLDMSHIGMHASDTQALAGALAENDTLESINLSSNGMGTEGAAQIVGMLEVTSSLRHVNLFSNYIESGASEAIGSMLRKNSTLEDLNLSYNKLGDSICHTLEKVMQANSTLRSLNLSGNGCSDDGYAAIAGMLKTNRTLRTLTIYPDPSSRHRHAPSLANKVSLHDSEDKENPACNTDATSTAATRPPRCTYDGTECLLTIEAQTLQVLLNHPRRHVFNLKGPQLSQAVMLPMFKTSFPVSACAWSNLEICQQIYDTHVSKFLAFVMGIHERLGEMSEVRFMGEDLVYAIVQTLFVI
jgi:hypothetical protein